MSNKKDNRLRAVTASWQILWIVSIFWFLQLLFFFIGMLGLAAETIIIVNWFLPTVEIFYFTYALNLIIGIISLIIGFIIYKLRRVDCLGGSRWIFLLASLGLYAAAFINWLPWILLWQASIIFSTKHSETGDTSV